MVDKRKDVNPDAGENEYGDVPFADEKNKKYPIDTAEHIRAAWNYIHKDKNAGKYSPEDVKTIKGKIAAAWRKKIDSAGPPGAQMARDDLTPTQLHGVEIFEAGKWPGSGVNGYRFTVKDLDDIVSSFGALGLEGRVPIKIGHDDADFMDSDGAPALGWVEHVWRDDDKLMADITLVSPKLARLLEAKAYKFVSVELLRDVQADTRKIPWVLDAVALLGASPPAVGVLKDLQASLRMARGAGLRSGTRVTCRREFNNSGVRRRMAKNQNDDDSTGMDSDDVQAMIDKALEPHKSEMAKLKADLKDAVTAKMAAECKAHRAAIVAVFEKNIASGAILPAAREKFSKTYGVDDDEKVMKVSVKDAEDFVAGAKDMPGLAGTGKSGGAKSKLAFGRDEIDTAGKSAAEIVSELTEAQMQADGAKSEDYSARERAYFKVLRKFPEVARAYMNAPADEIAAAA